jgi:hypothetical protein
MRRAENGCIAQQKVPFTILKHRDSLIFRWSYWFIACLQVYWKCSFCWLVSRAIAYLVSVSREHDSGLKCKSKKKSFHHWSLVHLPYRSEHFHSLETVPVQCIDDHTVLIPFVIYCYANLCIHMVRLEICIHMVRLEICTHMHFHPVLRPCSVLLRHVIPFNILRI